jgi:hypothetical protein
MQQCAGSGEDGEDQVARELWDVSAVRLEDTTDILCSLVADLKWALGIEQGLASEA